MQPTIRRTALAGVAVATLTLVGACGSGSSDHATDTKTTGGDSSTSAVSALQPGDAVTAVDAKSIVTSATGDLTSMKLSADVSAGSAGTMHMEGVEQTKPLLAQMAMTVAGQQMEFRMIGTDIYVQVPAASGLPGGKKWMSMNMNDIGSLTGMDTSGLSSAMQDPAASLDKYSKYITGGTYVGPSTVDGVSAKQYDFTLDVKGAMAEMMPNGVPSSAAGQLPASMKESIWIDGDNHPVQMKMAMGQLGDTTMHFSDFGTKVSVTAPPKNEVADMAQLMKGAGGAS